MFHQRHILGLYRIQPKQLKYVVPFGSIVPMRRIIQQQPNQYYRSHHKMSSTSKLSTNGSIDSIFMTNVVPHCVIYSSSTFYHHDRRHHQCFMYNKINRRKTGIVLFSTASDSIEVDSTNKKISKKKKDVKSKLINNKRETTRKSQSASLNSSRKNLDVESNINDINLDENEKVVYQELVTLVKEIMYNDNLYYNSQLQTNEQIISDEMYDSLVSREEYICTNYPKVYKLYQQEYPTTPTRFSGLRIGSAAISNPITEDTAGAQQQQQKEQVVNVSNSISKRKHLRPMLSLDNIHNKDQLTGWITRIITNLQNSINATTKTDATNNNHASDISTPQQELQSFVTISTEPKLDGISLNLRYRRRTSNTTNESKDKHHPIEQVVYDLEWACTRGDGRVGTDVTVAVKQGQFVPHEVNIFNNSNNIIFDITTDTFEVRGEVVLPRSEFNRMKLNMTRIEQQQQTDTKLEKDIRTGAETNTMPSFFSNPRNAASGILQRKYNEDDDVVDDTIMLRSNLRFYAYELVFDSNNTNVSMLVPGRHHTSYLDVRALLQSWNFTIPQPFTTSSLPLDCDVDISIVDSHYQNLLDYYNELQQWREQQEKKQIELSSSLENTSKSTVSSLSKHIKWEWDDYDVDGCVHKVCELQYRVTLGTTTRAPKWAIAHKFPALVGMTRLRSIEVQVGRTGVLTPVAYLDPIVLNGVTIQRATLHNFNHMQHMLSKSTNTDHVVRMNEESSSVTEIPVGTHVIVRRAGDVIPQVISRAVFKHDSITNNHNNTIDMISLLPPTHCPACGSPVVITENVADSRKSMTSTRPTTTMKKTRRKKGSIESSDESTETDTDSLLVSTAIDANATGRIVRCSGPSLLCPPQAIGTLQQAFSRDAMDITGLSEARIRQLKEVNILNMPYDLFSIFVDELKGKNTSTNANNVNVEAGNGSRMHNTSIREQIAELDGWGEKSVNNLGTVVNRVAANGISLSRYIYSLNIRNVGVHISTILATIYQSADEFLFDLEQAALEPPVTSLSPKNTSASSKIDDLKVDIGVKRIPKNVFVRLQEETEYTKGIGPVVISALYDFSHQSILLDAARKLTKYIPIHKETKLQQQQSEGNYGNDIKKSTERLPFNGMSVVFTGTLSNEMSRTDAQKYAIEYLGATSTPSRITKSTDVLVLGTNTKTAADAATKKRQQAEQYGTKIMNASEFLLLLSNYKK
jgi:NAD-dependent DNA ligase